MTTEKIKEIKDIKDLMERSSRFLSLSGLSGVFAGAFALLGAAFAFFILDYDERFFDTNRYFSEGRNYIFTRQIVYLLIDAFVVLFFALSFAIFFTVRKANKKKLKVWDHTTRRLLINVFIPLSAGGIFSFILLYYGIGFLIAPVTLIFYGLALINAAKYTLTEIRWLGISELILGLIGCVFIGYGIWFWAFGFGVLHIVYGSLMYFKYEA